MMFSGGIISQIGCIFSVSLVVLEPCQNLADHRQTADFDEIILITYFRIFLNNSGKLITATQCI